MLLDIPELVLSQVLSYLPPEDLKTLRLVCRGTKSWVESRPQILQKLQLVLSSEACFTRIVKSQWFVPWSNIKIHYYNTSVFKRPKLLLQFLDRFGQYIKIIDFSNSSWEKNYSNDTAEEFVLACPNLEVLKVYELSCKRISTEPDGLKILKNNWANLQYLEITQLLCDDYFGVKYFAELLSGCDNLVELVPPLITITSPDYLSFNYKKVFKEYVLRPIIGLLKSSNVRKNSLRKLHVQEYLLDSDPQLILELVQACLDNGTVLYPETFIPFSNSGFLKVIRDDRERMLILGALSGMNDVLMGGREATESGQFRKNVMNNVELFSISFRSFYVSEEVLKTRDIPIFPRLKRVEIEMAECPPFGDLRAELELSRFVKKFCTTPRLSVGELHLAESKRADATGMVGAMDISKGFPNLTRLKIDNWDAGNTEFQILWRDLTKLMKISLKFCQNLSDEGFVGAKLDGALFLGLKELKILCLHNTGPITDVSYVTVFRNMRLKKFHHHNTCDTTVTRRGCNALTKGVFRESIRELIMSVSLKSEFKNMDRFCEFLDLFPKMKKPGFGTDSLDIYAGKRVYENTGMNADGLDDDNERLNPVLPTHNSCCTIF